MPVHWKVTWMLVVSLRGRKGRFWSHVGRLRQRAKFFGPQRSAHQKKNAVIQAVLEHGLLYRGQKPAPRPYWSPLGDWLAPIQTSYFIGPYNLHYLLFSGIGALLCHHPYCFPSQSQTLFGIVAGRPPLGQYRSDKHSCDFYMSSPWPLVSHLHSNGFCQHGKRPNRIQNYNFQPAGKPIKVPWALVWRRVLKKFSC